LRKLALAGIGAALSTACVTLYVSERLTLSADVDADISTYLLASHPYLATALVAVSATSFAQLLSLVVWIAHVLPPTSLQAKHRPLFVIAALGTSTILLLTCSLEAAGTLDRCQPAPSPSPLTPVPDPLTPEPSPSPHLTPTLLIPKASPSHPKPDPQRFTSTLLVLTLYPRARP
jgi:hypothetical protein